MDKMIDRMTEDWIAFFAEIVFTETRKKAIEGYDAPQICESCFNILSNLAAKVLKSPVTNEEANRMADFFEDRIKECCAGIAKPPDAVMYAETFAQNLIKEKWNNWIKK